MPISRSMVSMGMGTKAEMEIMRFEKDSSGQKRG